MREIGFGVFLNFLGCQIFTGLGTAGGVADHPGKVTNQKNDLMAQLLELPHLVQENRVPEMQVGGCGIKPRFHPQGFSGSQQCGKVFFADNFGSAPENGFKLFLYRNHIF